MSARRLTFWPALTVFGLALACGRPEGTVDLTIAVAPGSDLMDEVERVRLTLSDPPATREAERGPDGDFALALEVSADGERGRITLEGFGANGQLVAVGHAGPVPIAAIDAQIAIYVAAPDSIAEAPVAFDPPRSEFGAAPLGFGAVFAGGRDDAGDVLGEALIYNVHSHGFQRGAPMPEPRAEPAVAASEPDDTVYIFGGVGEAGEAEGTGWIFDTATPPAGVYDELDAHAHLARAGRAAAPLAGGRALVAGDPLVQLDPVARTVREVQGAPPMTGTATTARDDEAQIVFLTGQEGDDVAAARFEDGRAEPLEAPSDLERRGHGAAALPGGDVLVVGGEAAGTPLASAVRYSPEQSGGDDFEVVSEFLATPRTGAAVARARDRLLVVGGQDEGGAVLADAELFDAETLAPIAELPLSAARRGAVALPLANGQILIAGGTDQQGDPVGALELFTPDA